VEPEPAASDSQLAARAAAPSPGLYLVATPIGNLGDITLRALALLRHATVVACEDTRVTQKLLSAHGIAAAGRLVACHAHNARQMAERLALRIAGGASVALVSDAGTPLVSDPGFELVAACRARGLAVTALPGASAALTALQLSGLPAERFLFAGFLPPRAGPRQAAIEDLQAVPATLILYEAPHRLLATLGDLARLLGERPAAVARELTKLYEEVRRGSLPELAAHYAAAGPPKGEIVILVAPPAPAAPTGTAELTALLTAALARQSLRDAVAEVAQATGLPKRQVYAAALALEAGGDADAG